MNPTNLNSTTHLVSSIQYYQQIIPKFLPQHQTDPNDEGKVVGKLHMKKPINFKSTCAISNEYQPHGHTVR
jgi:hypothetical protein